MKRTETSSSARWSSVTSVSTLRPPDPRGVGLRRLVGLRLSVLSVFAVFAVFAVSIFLRPTRGTARPAERRHCRQFRAR